MTAGAPAIREFSVPIPAGMYAPATQHAIREAGEVIRAKWIELASDHSTTGNYLSHLRDNPPLYPFQGDRDRVAVVNTLPQAAWLEWGRAGFHLAQRWGTGKGKWKIGPSGRRYATVAFRHRSPITTPGSTSERRRTAMTTQMYNTAVKLDHGQRLKLSDVVNYRGGKATVGEHGLQSKSYEYYRRAFGADAVPEHLPQGYTWATPKYEGMVHNKDGEGKHGGYWTFRTITEDSPGWYIPPTPAHHYAQRALDATAPDIQQRLDAAAYFDVGSLITAAISPLY
jgi:hypothetical protein